MSDKSNKVLVLGATGTVGAPVVQGLQALGIPVRAASRSGRAVGGAEGVVFAYDRAETVQAAFAGTDRAYVLLPSGYVEVQAMLSPVLEAARAHGTKVVLQSVFGVDADDAIPYRQVELALERSGLRYVILRPNWFADNFHTFWKGGVAGGRIAVPAGAGRTSFIDARDIAASAVAALASDRFDGQAYNLTGPEALGYAEAAAILSRAVGRPIAYAPIEPAEFVTQLVAAGVSAAYAAFLAAIFEPVRQGWTAAVTGDVERLTGRAPRSLEAYARDHAADLGA